MTTTDTSSTSGPVLAHSPSAIDENSAAVKTPEELQQEARKRRRKRILLAFFGLLVLVFIALVAWYLLNRKPLSALPGLSDDKMPHYVSSIYGSSRPIGVAVSPSGERIYVTESDGTKLVRVFDRAGKQVGTLKPPKSTGTAHVPVYVAVDPITSDVYVSDRPAQAVFVYNAKGVYQRTFKPRGDLGGGWAPLGLAFDKRGDLYVTDVSGKTHRVLVFGRDGTLTRTLGVKDNLVFPNGIAIDPRGTAYVSDGNNGRLVTFGPAGKFAATINRGVGKGDLGLPRGAAIDNNERLYVVDTSDHNVKVFGIAAAKSSSAKSPSARYIGSFGEEGQLDGTFEFPNGVATDTRSRVYVTDRENDRVQIWSY